jgi:PKD repeat protein
MVGVFILLAGLLAIPGIGFYTLPNINVNGASTTKLSTVGTPTSPLWFNHIVVLMMENEGIGNVCTTGTVSCSATGPDPYLAALANQYQFSLQFTSVYTPLTSLPNYIAMIGGSTFNCNSGGCGTAGPGQAISASNLVDELTQHGLTWKAYIENYPRASGCGADYGIPPYNIGHNPFIWFNDIYNNQSRCSNIVDANPTTLGSQTCNLGPNGWGSDCQLISDLDGTSAANFIWVTPNDCNNMHSATNCEANCQNPGTACITAGDAYLASVVPSILGSATFTSGQGALFIDFDEGEGYCPYTGGSQDCVLAFFSGPRATSGPPVITPFNHYSFLRTVEDNWGLAYLQVNDADASNLGIFLKPINAPPPGPLEIAYTYAPLQPVVNGRVTFSAIATGGTIPYSFSWQFINSGGVLIGTNDTQSATFKFTTAGDYTVKAIVVDSQTPPATNSVSATVTVLAPTPQLVAGFGFGPDDAPAGTIVNFHATASGGVPPYTYTWTFGDGGSASGQNVTNNYPTGGNYNATLTVNDAETPPASQKVTQDVSVTNAVGSPSATFSLQPQIGIVNQVVDFVALVNGGTPPYSYSWTFSLNGAIVGSGQTNPYLITFGQAGGYLATLTVTDAASKQTTTSQSFTVQAAVVQTMSSGIPLWIPLVILGSILTILPFAFIRKGKPKTS